MAMFYRYYLLLAMLYRYLQIFFGYKTIDMMYTMRIKPSIFCNFQQQYFVTHCSTLRITKIQFNILQYL